MYKSTAGIGEYKSKSPELRKSGNDYVPPQRLSKRFPTISSSFLPSNNEFNEFESKLKAFESNYINASPINFSDMNTLNTTHQDSFATNTNNFMKNKTPTNHRNSSSSFDGLKAFQKVPENNIPKIGNNNEHTQTHHNPSYSFQNYPPKNNEPKKAYSPNEISAKIPILMYSEKKESYSPRVMNQYEKFQKKIDFENYSNQKEERQNLQIDTKKPFIPIKESENKLNYDFNNFDSILKKCDALLANSPLNNKKNFEPQSAFVTSEHNSPILNEKPNFFSPSYPKPPIYSQKNVARPLIQLEPSFTSNNKNIPINSNLESHNNINLISNNISNLEFPTAQNIIKFETKNDYRDKYQGSIYYNDFFLDKSAVLLKKSEPEEDMKKLSPIKFKSEDVLKETKLFENHWKAENFQIKKSIGSGKFSKVYLARDIKTGMVVALKMIEKKLLIETKNENQLALEIKVQSLLKHPNILQLFGFFNSKDKICLILECATHGELYKDLKKQPNKRYDEITAALYIRQITEALLYMHENNVVHRDIKPENDMLKLCDFGWAGIYQEKNRTSFCGTLDYVSPEVVVGENYDKSVDIWGLGVLCYELVTGEAPFYRETSKKTYNDILTVNFTFPEYVSRDLKDLIKRFLRREPSERITLYEVLKHKWIIENTQRYIQNCNDKILTMIKDLLMR